MPRSLDRASSCPLRVIRVRPRRNRAQCSRKHEHNERDESPHDEDDGQHCHRLHLPDTYPCPDRGAGTRWNEIDTHTQARIGDTGKKCGTSSPRNAERLPSFRVANELPARVDPNYTGWAPGAGPYSALACPSSRSPTSSPVARGRRRMSSRAGRTTTSSRRPRRPPRPTSPSRPSSAADHPATTASRRGSWTTARSTDGSSSTCSRCAGRCASCRATPPDRSPRSVSRARTTGAGSRAGARRGCRSGPDAGRSAPAAPSTSARAPPARSSASSWRSGRSVPSG